MQRHFMAGVIAGMSLIAAACGGATATESSTSDASLSTETTTVDSTAAVASTETTAAPVDPVEVPNAIISLSPTATEMLYAVGAGDQVIAVDDFSNFPADTASKMPGISGFDPNIEAILALNADLIVTDGTNPDLIDAIERAGIAHWAGPAATTIDDTLRQIADIGAATGHATEAAALVDDMEADLADLMARIEALPDADEPLTYYHELDNTYYSVTSDTFIGSTYTMLGLRNIADLAEGESYGYPQLSAEFILDKDPDLIFLACTIYCGETPESVAARPGWDTLTAVAQGNVVPLDDDTASRWGPRIVDHMATVVDAVERVLASGAE